MNLNMVLNAAKVFYDGKILIIVSGYHLDLSNIRSFIDRLSEIAEIEVTITKDSFEFHEE
ncbi:hypothetical protein [Geoglobus acetivorans]|uniref:Uncharacterized protein n=1 Tax=Geoglobus acetivorans TaxID=565033 RepID=A0A0A7GCZ2_GEOAI|nr:hypothetical protein GACE_0898 [Geoglobus acetivorans]